MPRIDPIQLLNCLSVLLSPNGGIKSRDEVHRLACLMTKFSKKLVSKCIYIQILKCTETDLLGLFMGSGGWVLVHMWLTESIVAKNWPLVKELLELLLLCPVDIERLKTNNCPKLVKELSKDGNYHAIRALATKLVEQWLKTVKGEEVIVLRVADIPKVISEAQFVMNSDIKNENIDKIERSFETYIESNTNIKSEIEEVKRENSDEVEHKNIFTEHTKDNVDIGKIDSKEKSAEVSVDSKQDILPVLKISLKDGKKVVSKVEDTETKQQDELDATESTKKNKDKSKDKNRSSKSSSNSSKHSSKSHSSSRDKHRSGSSSSSSSSRHNSSKDGSKDRDRHSSHNSKSSESKSKKSGDKPYSSSSKSREESSRSSERDKSKDKKDSKSDRSKDDTSKSKDKNDEKSQIPSIHKLGKIPKIGDVKKEKPSISIEVRKPDEPKPKTVKTFNSKFRKHGLEEEIKPPPSRASLLNKKSPPVLPPSIPIPKRPSPVHSDTPPEKKIKTVENIEKPGAIKLIPPKPKLLFVKCDTREPSLDSHEDNATGP